MPELPFMLDGEDVLEPAPRARLEEGVVYRAADRPDVLLSVAWLDDPAGLEAAVREDLARMLSDPATVLVDREATAVGGIDAVRTFVLDAGELPAAREQWRLVARGRRWTVTGITSIADQPLWGPRLARVAATFRPR